MSGCQGCEEALGTWGSCWIPRGSGLVLPGSDSPPFQAPKPALFQGPQPRLAHSHCHKAPCTLLEAQLLLPMVLLLLP